MKSLRETHTLNMRPIKGEINRTPNIGEAVIIKEEGTPRGNWKIARIENLIKSDVDGVCRAASLVLSSGRKLKRPFRLIYPLEGNGIDKKLNDDISTDNAVGDVDERNNDTNIGDTEDEMRNLDLNVGETEEEDVNEKIDDDAAKMLILIPEMVTIM